MPMRVAMPVFVCEYKNDNRSKAVSSVERFGEVASRGCWAWLSGAGFRI